MSNELISIVIPHFERVDLIKITIDSIKSQTDPNWELIIVDDGSNQQTLKALHDLSDRSRIRVFQRTDGDKGPSRCRNLGVKQARGEWIMFVDSDDWMAPWCLEQRRAAMESNPDAGFIVFPVALFQNVPGDQDVLWNELDSSRDDLTRFLSSDSPWHTSSPLWRRSAFTSIHGFNERVFYGDDSDLHMRALLEGIPYRKEADATPDHFVRRADDDRVTNKRTNPILASRLVRLEQGWQAIREYKQTDRFTTAWNAQYFIELEYLIFKNTANWTAIEQALSGWKSNMNPPILWSAFMSCYCRLGHKTWQQTRLPMRVAQRLAKLILPKTFFPPPSLFEKAPIAPKHRQRLHALQPTG
ncbi:MAG: glycosyltransferase family A protein [Verrucomicrobiota bacterium]